MTRAEKDLEAWKKWNADKSPANLRALMRQLDPAIQSHVNKWSGAIARPVVEAKAKKLAFEAIKSYNPNAGAALATHITNRMQKVSRTVYTHQDAVRLPEHRKLKAYSLYKANEELLNEHGREATNQELQDHLGWSPEYLSHIQSSMATELVQSQDVGGGLFEKESVWGADAEDGSIDLVYYDLPPTDKIIFEHSTGYSGKPILSNPEVAKKAGITTNQLSYRKKIIIAKIKETQT